MRESIRSGLELPVEAYEERSSRDLEDRLHLGAPDVDAL